MTDSAPRISVVFDATPYFRSHGRTPRGRGLWMFHRWPSPDGGDDGYIHHNGTFTEAMMHAREVVRAQMAHAEPRRQHRVTLFVQP